MKKTAQQIKELILQARKELEEMEWELANSPTVINEEVENRWVELTNKIIIREKYIDWLIKKFMERKKYEIAAVAEGRGYFYIKTQIDPDTLRRFRQSFIETLKSKPNKS